MEKSGRGLPGTPTELGTWPSSWEAGVGARLRVIAEKIGKDNSVSVTGRSWKQLQRYFQGADAPASVVKAFADAARGSTDYILQGRIIRSGDAEIARRLIDSDLRLVRAKIEENKDTNPRLIDIQMRLLKASGNLLETQIGLFVEEEPGYGYLFQKPLKANEEDSGAQEISPLNEELLEACISGVEKHLADRRQTLPPAKKATLISLLYMEVLERERELPHTDKPGGEALGDLIGRFVRLAS